MQKVDQDRDPNRVRSLSGRTVLSRAPINEQALYGRRLGGDDLPTDWMLQARCRGRTDLDFYPGRGKPGNELKAMQACCAACPVRQECEDYGMFENHGWWGGVSQRERRMRRKIQDAT